MEDMGKSMFTRFVTCTFRVPCFRQLSVTEGFPDHCSMEWLSKLGVSAIIPQTAAGYSILSKFHFLCVRRLLLLPSAVGFLLSHKYETHTLQMCDAVHY